MPTIRGVLVAAALILTGCGIPIRVERIDDPAAPVQGVRYTLHRPSYEVFVVATKTGYAVVQTSFYALSSDGACTTLSSGRASF